VIVGLNRIVAHAGKDYHLQVEDAGFETAAYDVRVYDGGSVVWHKRVSYAELAQRAVPRDEAERELHTAMEKTLHTLEAAIVKGKLL
jgi:hypothetical protein